MIVQWLKKYALDFVDSFYFDTAAPNEKKVDAASGLVRRAVLKTDILDSIMDFTESVLAYDQPLSAKQIRKNIMKMVRIKVR